MGKYNFDEEINRYNTNSLKFDILRGRPKGILPLWVADYDFKAPEFLLDELKKRVDHGIFGYSEPTESYFTALKGWYKRHYDVDIDTNKVILTCGVVFSICQLIRSVTKENDYIIINEPVYYPFKASIISNDRLCISSDLKKIDNKYYFDFADFEEKIKKYNVKAYILCNPHNPVGRCWKKEELEKVFEICKKYNVFVISDEIHADIVYNDNKFISAHKLLDKNFAIASSLSKPFNIPGLQAAHTYINEKDVYEKFLKELDRVGYSQLSTLGLVGSEILFNKGDEYLEELKEYLWSNINYVKDFISKNLPKLKVIDIEATYLLWIDFSAYNISDKKLKELITYDCNLWLDDGLIFGKSGSGYQRINIATTKKMLDLALNNLYNVFKNL